MRWRRTNNRGGGSRISEIGKCHFVCVTTHGKDDSSEQQSWENVVHSDVQPECDGDDAVTCYCYPPDSKLVYDEAGNQVTAQGYRFVDEQERARN